MKELTGVPGGYTHKATSDSLLGTESVMIYHSINEDNYLIVVAPYSDEYGEMYVTKAQLTLLVQSANDVLEME